MFGQWRLTLCQAEEALRSERFEEALELARRPELADHRQAVRLRDRIAGRLLDRAQEHLGQGHSHAAWNDLRQAELAGAPGARVESVRAELAERGVAEVRAALDAGNPIQATALVKELNARGADSAELRRLQEAAAAWAAAGRAIQLGEFSRAARDLEVARNHLAGHARLEQNWANFEVDRARASEIRGWLESAIAGQVWANVLNAANQLLEIAPDSRDAHHARDEAMRRLGVHVSKHTIAAATARDIAPPRGFEENKNGSRSRFILWVDGSGGFLVCLGNVISVGQANSDSAVDIPILGDLSRNHATLFRDREGYLIRSDREMRVNGRPTRQSPLQNGDSIRLGASVELTFHMPSPVSETARLALTSRHRLHLSLAGILLMADTCVLGPSAQSHVRLPEAGGQVVIYRQGEAIWCRGDGEIEIDGRPCDARGQLRMPSRAAIGELSFSLEPLSSPLIQV